MSLKLKNSEITGTEAQPEGFTPGLTETGAEQNWLVFENLYGSFDFGLIQVTDDFSITQINAKAIRIFGFENQQFKGKKIWESGILLYNENNKLLVEQTIQEWFLNHRSNEINVIKIVNPNIDLQKWIKIRISSNFEDSTTKNKSFVILIEEFSEQKQNEIILQKQLQLEQIVTNISTRFVSIDDEEIDNEINNALANIGNFTRIDRAYVFLYNFSKEEMSNSHEWCAPGISVEIDNLQELPLSIFPWWNEKIQKNDIIFLHTLEDLPNEAVTEKEILEAQDIKSLLVVPIFNSGQSFGFIGFDSVKTHKNWTESDIRLLRQVGEIFGNTLKNSELNKQLLKYNRDLEETVTIRTREKQELISLNSSIVETSGVIIITTDTDGIIKSFNPMAEKLLGYKAKDVVNKLNLTSLFHIEEINLLVKQTWDKGNFEEFTNPFSSIVNKASKSAPNPFECSLISKNKRIIYVLLSLNPILNETGQVHQYATVAIDIGHRKEAENAMMLQNTAFESFTYPLIITDLNGIIMWTNKSFAQMSGFSFEEVVNQKIGKLQKSGEHTDLFYKSMWETILAGNIWKGEIINKRKDQSLYTEEMTITPLKNRRGKIVNFVAIKIDITEKKRAEAAQKEQDKINEAILNNVPDILFHIDKNGKYLGAHTRDEKNLFTTRDQFLGKSINQILPPETAKEAMDKLLFAFETRSIVSYEYSLKINNEDHHFENRIIVISDNEALSIIRNITEMKKDKESLQTTLLQLNTLVENMQTGTLFEDSTRHILLVNPYFCSLFNIPVSPEELVGIDCVDASTASSELMINPQKFLNRINETLEKGEIVTNDELYLTDGRVLERDYIPIRLGQKLLGHLWQYRDITQRKLNEKNSFIQRDLGFNLAITSTLEEALNQVILSALEIDQIHAAGIYLFNPKIQELELVVSNGFSAAFINNAKTYTKDHPQYKLVIAGENRYSDSMDMLPVSNLLETEQLKKLGIFPVKHENKIIGSLNIASRNAGDLSNSARIALEAIVAQIGGALSRINSQNALLTSKENFRLMFDTVDDFMFILDPSGKIIKTNPVVETRLGYSQEELAGKSVIQIHPEKRQEEAAIVVMKMINGEQEFCPIPLVAKDGKIIPVETKVVRGKWDGEDALYGISRDISERLKAEETLRNSEARWQFALESSGDGIWDWDFTSNTVFYSNQWKKMLGYNDSDISENLAEWESRVHPDDLERVKKELQKHLQAKNNIYQSRHRMLCKDGTYKWILDRGKVIATDKSGNPERLIGTHSDISIQKAYEDSLLESLQKEKELNELKSRFVSITSHEFRTPLSTIQIAADTLANYISKMSETEIKDKLSRIQHNIDFLRKLMDKILNLSHLESGKIKFVPVKTNYIQLVEDIVEEQYNFPGLKHKIELVKPKEAIFIAIDKQMMEQVLNNLISNGIKYSPEGTTIKIEITVQNADLVTTVEDQGIGIMESDESKLFIPFQRGNNVGNIRGSGLGLALSKQFIELHEGLISFTSVINKGTTFKIVLPGILQ